MKPTETVAGTAGTIKAPLQLLVCHFIMGYVHMSIGQLCKAPPWLIQMCIWNMNILCQILSSWRSSRYRRLSRRTRYWKVSNFLLFHWLCSLRIMAAAFVMLLLRLLLNDSCNFNSSIFRSRRKRQRKNIQLLSLPLTFILERQRENIHLLSLPLT